MKPRLGTVTGIVLAAIMTMTGCASRPRAVARLEGLGRHSFPISTASVSAQEHFDRGLTLAYGFMHYAAEQEFRAAAAADPQCAMAHWGIALVNGPHINYPVVPEHRAATAWEAITRARALAGHATPLEQALIQALGARYADPQPADRAPLDTAYAAAMRRLWQAHPDHADVGTLFVEAAMDLHPWDLWKDGEPRPWTPEIVGDLERILRIAPDHPGATHLYIHAVEASPQPERALAAADRLRRVAPDASHLVHMPGHIYVRVGRWEEAARANRDAMKADARYRAAYPRPGFHAMYMAHNSHFLAWVSMMQGRQAETIRLARRMVADIPDEFIADYPGIADGFTILVSEALMRFGRWDEILAEPRPRAGLPLALALWHFTRATALTALHRPDEARAEKAAFDRAVAVVPAGWTFGNNAAADLLAIARLVLDGEMSAATGDYPAAVAALREAALREDQLVYDEPPDWIQPVRHTLGAVLMKAGRFAEAETVYREDLARYPENGWSLMGLRDALRRQERTVEARAVNVRFRKAWARADVSPPSTCYCQSVKQPR